MAMVMVMPSPGIVTEPHFTSIAIPKPRMVQPAICTIVLMRRFSEAIHSVSIILRSMSIPKKKPITSWKSCTQSKLRLSISICMPTKTTFIIMVYSSWCPWQRYCLFCLHQSGDKTAKLGQERSLQAALEPSSQRRLCLERTVCLDGRNCKIIPQFGIINSL